MFGFESCYSQGKLTASAERRRPRPGRHELLQTPGLSLIEATIPKLLQVGEIVLLSCSRELPLQSLPQPHFEAMLRNEPSILYLVPFTFLLA